MANKQAWHTMDTEQICTRLETNSTKGLAKKQAAARAKKLSIRQPDSLLPLFIPTKRPLYRDLAKMLLDPILLLTLFVALIACFFGKQYALGGVIVAILLCNALFCAVSKAKAKEVWSKLQLYSNPMTKIIRSGRLYTTDARNVLPGDVVILQAGDICPADVRLDRGSQVRVKQYVLSTAQSGKFEQVTVEKSGDAIYQPGQEVFNPDCVNIVYAGSVIVQGFARGIAVETGRHTYIGASNGTVPGTNHITEPDSIAFIKKYFMRFSTVQAILLVPLTILLTVTMRSSLSFAECFLTALALCCTAITEHIVSLAGIVRAGGIDSAASEQHNASVAIIKNSDAADKLCEMTDLVLLDSAAISDGKYHLESVYACGSIYNPGELLNANVHRLVKDLYLYRSASRPPSAADHDAFDAGLTAPIDALIKHVAVDTAAIDLTKSGSYVSMQGDVFTVHNRLNSGEYSVLLSSDEQLLQQCTHVAAADVQKELDDAEHIALRTLCRIYRESGYRVLLVANQTQDCVSLIGVLAFSHRPGYAFGECCEQLMESGVRVSVFMPNTPESMKILTECKLVRDQDNDVLTAQAAEADGLDLHVAYGSYRAYLGFTQSQIADLLEKLKQRGNRVASYCVDNQAQDLHDLADLTITCDAIEYRSSKVSESYYDKMPVEGKPFSARASQNMRRTSDVILRRASEQGGGLHGILTGRKYAFAINHNLANAITYLVTVQFFRLVLLTVPAMFGTHTLSAVSLLIFGLLIDVASVVLFAFATPSKAALSASYPIMRRLEKPITYNTANVVSACVSALLAWLVFTVLQIFDITEPAQSLGFGFVSTYLLQGLVFVVTLREYNAQKKPSLLTLICIAAYVLILLACMLLPGLNVLTGCTTLSWITLLASPFAAIIYLITYRILSKHGLNLHK